ncbi:histidine kinase dimerization/phospho-acceptor domain-containing protein [Helicobacter sp. T3_23-1056]
MKLISSIYFKIFFLFFSAIILAILLAYEIDKSFHTSEIYRSKSEILYLIYSMMPNIIMGDFDSAQMLAGQFGFFALDSLPSTYTTLYQSTDDVIYSMIFSTKEIIGFELEYEGYHTIVSRPISYGLIVGDDFWLFFALFVGILTLLGVMVLRLLYPLRRLKKSLKSFISEMELSSHKINTKDEISALIVSFNMMSEQITRMLKSRELILKSLGHELKTPLTKMRLFVEVSQKEYPYMEKLLPHISGLKQLINNILELERLNSGKMQLESSRFFAETLVFETLKNFGDTEEKIRLEMRENFVICGDLELLARALRNLIENALKYNESPFIKIIIGDDACAQNAMLASKKMEQKNNDAQSSTNKAQNLATHTKSSDTDDINGTKHNARKLLGWGNINYTTALELESLNDSFASPTLKNTLKNALQKQNPKCISIVSKSPPLTHPFDYYTEPFVRDEAHNAQPGHGLGLSIVSDILALHGYALQYNYHRQKHYFSMVFTHLD